MYPYFDYKTLILYVLVAITSTYMLNLSINYKRNIRYSKEIGYIGFYLIFVLLATCRLVTYNIGGMDALRYEEFFLDCLNSTSRFTEEDVLFGFYNIFIRSITNNPILYRFICYSIITLAYIYFISSFCKKGVSTVPFIVLIIPYLKSFNTMRSSLAISVILCGLVLLKNKKTVWGIILICSTIFIHRMSVLYVLFLPFYAIFNKYKFTDSNIKNLIIISSLAIVGYVLALKVQQYAIAFSLLDGNDAYYIAKNLNGSILDSAVTLVPLLLLSMMWFVCNKKIIIRENLPFLELMISFDIIITPIAFILGMWRANEYFYLGRLAFWSYLIPIFCSYFSKNNRYFLKTIFIVFFLIWLIYRINREWEPCALMPYKTFF